MKGKNHYKYRYDVDDNIDEIVQLKKDGYSFEYIAKKFKEE